MNKVTFFTQMLGLIVLIIVVRIIMTTILRAVRSSKAGLPSWLVTVIKIFFRPDYFTVGQMLCLIPIYRTDLPGQIILWSMIALFLDGLDGFMATICPESKSKYGEVLDPIADRILIFGTARKCWITFRFNPTNLLLVGVMLGLDVMRALLVVGQRFYDENGVDRASANYWGKVKRNLQALSFIAFLLKPSVNTMLTVLLIPTMLCAVMSIVGHLFPEWQWYKSMNSWLSKPVDIIYRST